MRAIMTKVTAAAVLLLAACDGTPAEEGASPPPAAPVPPRPPAAPSPTDPAVGTAWSLSGADGGVGVKLTRDGAPVFRLTCLAGSDRVEAAVAGIDPIASEERFTLGAGDEAYTLVADLAASTPGDLRASGDAPADLLDRIERGEPLSVNYGAATVGPLPPLPEVARSVFAAGCRS
jgi:hypothetical protein